MDYLQTSFLDTPQSSPSSGTPTPAPSCESGQQMDGFQACACTKETCGCSTHPNTPAEWIASMRGSLARILASPEMALASMASEAACIVKSCASLTWYDRDSCFWKTHQQLLSTDWEPYLETWPRAGTMVGGQSWPLLTWVRPISASDGGACSGETRMVGSRVAALPTPTKHEFSTDIDHLEGRLKKHGRVSVTLACWVMLPTPRASDGAKGGPNQLQGGKPPLANIAAHWATPTECGNYNRKGASPTSGDGLATQAGGALNPTWVAWLMGWPLEHTKLQPLAMAKFLSARRRRGASSQGP